jgi:hypothetical protein
MIALGSIAGSTLATITYLNSRQSALSNQIFSTKSWNNNSWPQNVGLQKQQANLNLNTSTLSSKVDFTQFRQSFLDAVKRRDEIFIRSLITPQTQLTPGQSLSLENYRLEDGDSPFWQQIEKAITNGCTLEVTPQVTQQKIENEIWVCPKTFGKAIYDSDWQTEVAIIGERVNIRSSAQSNSRIVGIVSQDLARFDSERYFNLSATEQELVNQSDGWTPIILKNGRKGWVQNSLVYYKPRDYRISFVRVDGQWRLRYLLTGDSN